MITAHFHRAYWCYDNHLGIAKIHHEPLGIFAILFEGGIPKINVNFLDKNEFSYYWQKYKKVGVTLHHGYQIDRDVELIRVIEKDNIFKFSEINLEIKLENNLRSLANFPLLWSPLREQTPPPPHGSLRYFRPINGEWQDFQDDVFVEYKPCNSLIDVR